MGELLYDSPGTYMRIRLANTFGTGPLTLGPVDVAAAPQGGPAVDQATIRQVTFFGSPAVTVAQGGRPQRRGWPARPRR